MEDGENNQDSSPNDGNWLDTEHHSRVVRVAGCDSAHARKTAAEAEIARLVEDEQYLLAEREALGGDEHVDAIKRSGWFPYTRSIFLSARLAWVLDAILWSALWVGVWALMVRVFSHD